MKRFSAQISQLWVYPIKSCAGVSLSQVELTAHGLAQNRAQDRAWMVVDEDGEMVTQRDLPRMALIQPVLSPAPSLGLTLTAPNMPALSMNEETHALGVQKNVGVQRKTVRVWSDEVPAFDMGDAASEWLTQFLDCGTKSSSFGKLRLVRFDTAHQRVANLQWTKGVESLNLFSDGFPLLVCTEASLLALNQRLAKQGHPSVDMRRFRPNVVLVSTSDFEVAAHDEDRIDVMRFMATEHDQIQLKPVKPCPRCPIPNIDPDTAHINPVLSDVLQTYRQDPRVNGAATFGMNCITLSGVGRMLRVGQRVEADWVF
jgi:uncharacterized protein YcbX